jgi:hypothetical protein
MKTIVKLISPLISLACACLILFITIQLLLVPKANIDKALVAEDKDRISQARTASLVLVIIYGIQLFFGFIFVAMIGSLSSRSR